MSIIKALVSLFSSKPKEDRSTRLVPSKEYEPGLIDDFKHDHQELLQLFAAIQKAISSRNEDALYSALQAFGTALRVHVAKENVRFYVYVEHKHQADLAMRKRIQQYRLDMDEIGKDITRFIRTYSIPQQTDANWRALPAEMSKIASALSQRLHDEETELYDMYRP